mmetsp:Transcript_35384/g.75578  ORF Transcript_35384/g.75578 Transcript_35384/m.75578 type:complete len:224 (-) Transcript_35384:1399-2070(-)
MSLSKEEPGEALPWRRAGCNARNQGKPTSLRSGERRRRVHFIFARSINVYERPVRSASVPSNAPPTRLERVSSLKKVGWCRVAGKSAEERLFVCTSPDVPQRPMQCVHAIEPQYGARAQCSACAPSHELHRLGHDASSARGWPKSNSAPPLPKLYCAGSPSSRRSLFSSTSKIIGRPFGISISAMRSGGIERRCMKRPRIAFSEEEISTDLPALIPAGSITST